MPKSSVSSLISAAIAVVMGPPGDLGDGAGHARVVAPMRSRAPGVTVLPIAALFPILLWITARCRPVYAAAAVFLVSTAFVTTAVFGVGHFGNASIQFHDRTLQAQSAILFVAAIGCLYYGVKCTKEGWK